MTQRGARLDFQAALRDQGVEVVQFDFLTPEAVAAYCYERGYLQVPPCAAISRLCSLLPGNEGLALQLCFRSWGSSGSSRPRVPSLESPRRSAAGSADSERASI